MSSAQLLTVSAPAKINLTLEVLGKRSDGYHNIASIMQTIGLADALTFSPAQDLSLSCDLKELDTTSNLAFRAARMLKEEMRVDAGASICLSKRIPVSAGLGGGSSDAAATLKGLNALWGLGLVMEELLPLACRLGSDVPFFLRGGTVSVTGRGEVLDHLPAPPAQWVVVAAPVHELPNKTAALYGSLRPSDFTDGSATMRLAEAFREGSVVDSLSCFNVFETIAFGLFPQLKEYHALFLELGLESVRLSGTGPALYAVVRERSQGERIVSEMADRGVKAYLAKTLGPDSGVGPSA